MAPARAQKIGSPIIRLAAELRRDGLDGKAIEARLLASGGTIEEVRAALVYLDTVDRQIAVDARRTALQSAQNHIVIGALATGAGGLATLLTYLFARSGTVVLMFGLVAFGVYELQRGLALRRAHQHRPE
jgi:hypothetical protein